MPLLLTLEHVTKGGIAKNITKKILGAIANRGGLTPHQIRDWFMAFGAGGASTLQGKRNNVTNKLQVCHAPHMQDMQCMVH